MLHGTFTRLEARNECAFQLPAAANSRHRPRNPTLDRKSPEKVAVVSPGTGTPEGRSRTELRPRGNRRLAEPAVAVRSDGSTRGRGKLRSRDQRRFRRAGDSDRQT